MPKICTSLLLVLLAPVLVWAQPSPELTKAYYIAQKTYWKIVEIQKKELPLFSAELTLEASDGERLPLELRNQNAKALVVGDVLEFKTVATTRANLRTEEYLQYSRSNWPTIRWFFEGVKNPVAPHLTVVIGNKCL